MSSPSEFDQNKVQVAADFQNADARLGKLIYPTLWDSPSHSHYWNKTKFGMLAAMKKAISEFPVAQTIRVLDVGSATGADIFMYSRLLPQDRNYEFVGVDVSDVRVTDANSATVSLGLQNVSFEVGDAMSLDSVQGEFDIITTSEVIEHVPDPPAMISAIASKLRLGGHLVLTTPTVTRSSALFYKYLFRKLEKSTSAFESQLWAPMQVEAQKHSQGHISEMRVQRLSGILAENDLKLRGLRRGFLTYGGLGWDRVG